MSKREAKTQPATSPPQLNDVLQILKNVVNEIETNQDYRRDMATQLKETHGYSLEPNSSPENVIKEIAIEINYIFQKRVDFSDIRKKRVDLSDTRNKETETSLHQLLTRDKPKPNCPPKPLREYLDWNQYDGVLEAKSPLDLARKLKKDVPQWFVSNIIQHQFDIKWSTDTGEPEDYTFYQFYEMQNTSSLLKYAPRRAHVEATLYKKCRSISHDVQGKSKEELCPMVYIRTVAGWKSWKAGEPDDFNAVEDIDTDLNWIHRDILKFIKENADQQKDDRKSLKKSLKKPTLYWAVLDDKDLRPPTLNEFSKTQVYVGRAKYGIHGRWTVDSKNHCSMMKKCLDDVCAMTPYNALKLKGIQLVDARLALAKVREEERTALFVVKTFGDEFEKAKMSLQACLEVIPKTLSKLLPEPNSELLKYKDEIFPDVVTMFSDDAETLSNEAEEMLNTIEKYLNTAYKCLHKIPKTPTRETLRQKLNEAAACVKDLRNDSKKKLADRLKKAEASLIEAEKQHQNGERILNENLDIIPLSDPNERWQPKDMRYGMNY